MSDTTPYLMRLGASLADQGLQYARLMRLDRPVGIWLLLWPTLWALWIAGKGRPDPGLFAIFVAGVVVMRSAGCVINDLADREIDGHVARTRDRPLPSGTVTPAEALMLFIILALVAVALALVLEPLARLLAVGGALLTLIYPLCKRWLAAPQLVLGAAFGWGIPMAFAAQTGEVPRLAWLLWLNVVVWALVYDTMYAMADRDDDLRIGVRSTAILFGSADLFMISLLQAVLIGGLALAGHDAGLGSWYQAGVVLAALLALRHRWLVRDRTAAACLQAFRENHLIGGAIFAGIVLDFTFRGG
jgi:4-hydroxybenzoate polyprenyltransferase